MNVNVAPVRVIRKMNLMRVPCVIACNIPSRIIDRSFPPAVQRVRKVFRHDIARHDIFFSVILCIFAAWIGVIGGRQL